MPRYGVIHCLLEHKESLVVEEFLKTTPQDAEDRALTQNKCFSYDPYKSGI